MKRNLIPISIATALLVVSCSGADPIDSYRHSYLERGEDDDSSLDEGFFAGGEGTEADPYRITKSAHLKNMAEVLIPDMMVYFRLDADVDMSGIAWQPLNPTEPYSNLIGFDGNGHIIKNLTCRNQTYASFFGVLCGYIKDCGFVDADIYHGSSCTGVIGGYVGMNTPSDGDHTGVVENVFVSGKVTGGVAGGIAGRLGGSAGGRNTVIRNCYSTADVTALTDEGGGICGRMATEAEVYHCYSTGSLTASNATKGRMGGISGLPNTPSSKITGGISWNTSISAASGTAYRVSANPSNGMLEDCLGWSKTNGALKDDGVDTAVSARIRRTIREWGSPWSAKELDWPILEWQDARGDAGTLAGHSARPLSWEDPAPDVDDNVETEGPSNPVDDGEIPSGEGTQASPYLINNEKQLASLSLLMKSGTRIYVRLGKDIDMSTVENYVPANAASPYDKEIDFDGNGHTIRSFSCHSGSYQSLIGVLNGVFRNTVFQNADVGVEGVDHVGVVAGDIASGSLSAAVEQVTVDGALLTGRNFVGGIGGQILRSQIADCTLKGLTLVASGSSVGGIAGAAPTAASTISGCTVEAVITGRNNVGGILGTTTIAGTRISGNTFDGSISSTGLTGGILGAAIAGTTVENCTSSGSYAISTGNTLGGVVGNLVGSTVTGCFSSAELVGYQRVGGVVGGSYAASAEASSHVEKSGWRGAKVESTSRYCGGVIGFLERFVIVEDCFSDGPVIGGEQRTGGVGGSAGNYVEIRRCFARGDVTGRIGVAGILANGIASNNAASFQADYHITVEHCIAWSARVAASGGETNQWGSGAVMGATAKYNTLKGNWRNPAMELSYNPVDTAAPILYDQEDAAPESGLRFYGGAENPLDYAQPVYHGKAAPSGTTLSAVAKSLSWPETTWDLSGDVPVLHITKIVQ